MLLFGAIRLHRGCPKCLELTNMVNNAKLAVNPHILLAKSCVIDVQVFLKVRAI